MNEPGGIGYDLAEAHARIHALEDQVAVDTAIIKALSSECKIMRDALQEILDRTPANRHKIWPHPHWYLVTARKALEFVSGKQG